MQMICRMYSAIRAERDISMGPRGKLKWLDDGRSCRCFCRTSMPTGSRPLETDVGPKSDDECQGSSAVATRTVITVVFDPSSSTPIDFDVVARSFDLERFRPIHFETRVELLPLSTLIFMSVNS